MYHNYIVAHHVGVSIVVLTNKQQNNKVCGIPIKNKIY